MEQEESHYNTGVEYFYQHDYLKANEFLLQYVSEYDDAASYYFISRSFRGLGNFLESIKYIDFSLKASQRDGDFVDYYAYRDKGECLQAIGESKEAKCCFEEALNLINQKIKAWDYPALINAHKGLILHYLGNNKKAISFCKKALKINSKEAYTNYVLGIIYRSMGEEDLALINLNIAIKKEPAVLILALYEKALLLRDSNRQESINCLEKLLKKAPEYYLGNKLYEELTHSEEPLEFKEDELYEITKKKIVSPQELEMWQAKQERAAKHYEKFKKLMDDSSRVLEERKKEGSISPALYEELVQNGEYVIEHLEERNKKLHDEYASIAGLDDFLLKLEMRKIKAENDKMSSELTKRKKSLDSKNNDEKIKSLEAQVIESHKMMESLKAMIDANTKGRVAHDEILDLSGVKDKAEIKKYFQLFDEDKATSEYCHTFFWSLLNYFKSYALLKNGLIAYNPKDPSIKSLAENGLQLVKSTGIEITKIVPVAGNVVAALDTLINSSFAYVQKISEQNRINAINNIIVRKMGNEDDLSISIAKMAIAATLKRQDQLLEICEEGSIATKYKSTPLYNKSAFKKATKQYHKIQKKINDKKSSFFVADSYEESDAAQKALEDIVVLISYMFKNSPGICSNPHTLHEQMAEVMNSDAMVGALNLSKDKTCVIAYQDRIEYENPIINQEGLLQKLLEAFGPNMTNLIIDDAALLASEYDLTSTGVVADIAGYYSI